MLLLFCLDGLLWPNWAAIESAHQLQQALSTLRSDDPEVRLAAVHHLRAGRRRRLGRNYFPHAVAIGHGEESWGGSGADVPVC